MRNTNKKGFTIVELVVVVAVIAILAAVLIPTFSGIIKKAQLSADQKAVHDMNTFVAMEGADDLTKALAALEKNNVNVDNLSPITSGYSFVWVEADKKFALVETTEETKDIIDAIKEIEVVVTTVDYFLLAVNEGSNNIKLDADITVDRDIYVTGDNVTIDLNGKNYNTTQASNGRSGVLYVEEGATLTVTNGTLNVRSIQNKGDVTIKSDVVINAMDASGGACIRNKASGNVVIEGGTFNVVAYSSINDTANKGGAPAIYNENGTVTVNGGTFTSVTGAYLINNAGTGTITINAGSFTAFRGAISATAGEVIVNDGTFEVTNGEDSGWIAYAADGASIVLNGGEYSTVTSNTFNDNVTGEAKN